jgi:cytochrome b6-f complex iron-sulfur subunit
VTLVEAVERDKTEKNRKKPLLDIVLGQLESRREVLRRLGWIGVVVFLAGNLVATLRFFFPRVLFEPPSRFSVGRPDQYAMGTVSNQYKAKQRVWIVRTEDGQFFCLHAKCTHLGCTPNWLSVQKKFKCPCHGSGFYSTGENFEGPAPRPLDRFKMSLADDGQLIVDKSIVFKGVAGRDSDEVYPQSLLRV